MTNEHLTDLLSKYGSLFPIDEYQEIVQLIASKDFHSVLFKEEPQLFLWNKDDIVEWAWQCVRDRIRFAWRNCHESESTTFSTNKHILLGDIVLWKSFDVDEKPLELLIFEKSVNNDKNSQTVYQQKIELKKIFELDNRFIITLQKPIILRPNFKYEIQLKIGSFPSVNQYFTDPRQHHRLISKILIKNIDHEMITFQNLSEESLIYSLSFKMLKIIFFSKITKMQHVSIFILKFLGFFFSLESSFQI